MNPLPIVLSIFLLASPAAALAIEAQPTATAVGPAPASGGPAQHSFVVPVTRLGPARLDAASVPSPLAACGGLAPVQTHCESRFTVSAREEGVEVSEGAIDYGQLIQVLDGPFGRYTSFCSFYPPTSGRGWTCNDTLSGYFYEGDELTFTMDATRLGGYYDQVWGNGPVGFWQGAATA
ncbi:MAG TPA: hypothetical protein VM286_02445 [Candidatus Thermoplasmatota archaeon]|nr:hypothetical protein [Candidatus Thermoplasmatota archaeon]